MITEFFQIYMQHVARKYELHASNEPERNDWKKYMQGILDEVQEVTNEVKPNNAVYLEDELGDVLRDYMNVLHCLEKDGYIDSISSVFARSLKKYGQRIESIDMDGGINLKVSHWDEVKKKQKQENAHEHQQRYG